MIHIYSLTIPWKTQISEKKIQNIYTMAQRRKAYTCVWTYFLQPFLHVPILTGFKQILCAILSMCLLKWNFEKDFHFGSTWSKPWVTFLINSLYKLNQTPVTFYWDQKQCSNLSVKWPWDWRGGSAWRGTCYFWENWDSVPSAYLLAIKIPFCFIGGGDFRGAHKVWGHPTHVMEETSDE